MRPLSCCLVLALFVFLPLTHGHAQELQAPPTRSVGVGLGIAFANTIVPIAVGGALMQGLDPEWVGGLFFAYGFIVGPYLGNVYAGDKRRGSIGLGIRTGASLFAILAGLASHGFEDEGEGAEVFLLAGVVACVAADVWNIWTIPASVRRYNESLSVGPTLLPDGALGLQVQLRW